MIAAANRRILGMSAPTNPVEGQRWIEEGRQMAHQEGPAAFESIQIHHGAELLSSEVQVSEIEARGAQALERRDGLVRALQNLRFSPAEHAARMAQGKIDLLWAVGLLILNAALSLFVLMIFGPTWLTVLLSLLVLVSALPVEEFFRAHEEQAAFREGLFLSSTLE